MSRVLLITGASRSIRATTAKLAATRGYDVAINYAGNREAAEQVAVAVMQAGRRAHLIQGDIADRAAVTALFETVDREFGRLDAFFNNAGILWPHSRFVDI